jgi:hypothetical protein
MRRAAPFRVAVMCVVFIAACTSMVHGDRGPRPRSGPDKTGPGGRVFVARGTNVPDAAHSMHLSTGLIGAQHRYVMMIKSQQPADEETARDTLTRAVKTMFPGGRIWVRRPN